MCSSLVIAALVEETCLMDRITSTVNKWQNREYMMLIIVLSFALGGSGKCCKSASSLLMSALLMQTSPAPIGYRGRGRHTHTESSNWLSMSITSEFLRFDSASRVDLVKQLLGYCTHQEQLAIMEALSTYLRRDFLTLLPPELVFKILCLLDYREVLGYCSMVRPRAINITLKYVLSASSRPMLEIMS